MLRVYEHSFACKPTKYALRNVGCEIRILLPLAGGSRGGGRETKKLRLSQ